MSFQSRLTTFFMLIVVVPMAAFAVLVFRLIGESQDGKADARANGAASVATSEYVASSRSAGLDARNVARAVAGLDPAQLRARLAALASQAGLVRVTVAVGPRQLVSVGDPTALAPGVVVASTRRSGPTRTVTVSELTAPQYAREVAGSGVQAVVRQGAVTLASTLPGVGDQRLAPGATVTVAGDHYRVARQTFRGFGGRRIQIAFLSNLDATGGGAGGDRIVAALIIAGFLALAFCFALLASRALRQQLAAFLDAARRLGGGDFSSPVPVTGHDEFAELGVEFNSMSQQLEQRLDELERERARVRRAIRHIGEAFASNLDREALLELALRTAMDASVADRGRVSAREDAAEPLTETTHIGRLEGLEDVLYRSERSALEGNVVGEAANGDLSFASVALGPIAPGGPTHGVITVGRSGEKFSDDDLELLRSLAVRATLALANVNLHIDVQRQAITDDLTGLATHGHFQELLGVEMVAVSRYRYPVGLIMLDIDDFKSINDRYGHQQGDSVLRHMAAVIEQNSRDPDVVARYGGEEIALILPHTDLEGAYAIAERIRASLEAMEVPLPDGAGSLRVTASLGVAAASEGGKSELIHSADSALYRAKREGKNRTARALAESANLIGGR
jgi:diguanylate cyclase (GGDEF)-like protein